MDKVVFGKPDLGSLTREFTVVDMHSHTQASHDCSTQIERFGDRLRALKIGVAVTDHNEMKGSFALKAKYPNMFIIPGIEVTSFEDKHILLYFHSHNDLESFYERHINPTKKRHRTEAFRIRTTLPYAYVLDIAKDYNAFRVFPHPMIRGTGILRSLLKKKDFSVARNIDGIEVLNSTQKHKANVHSLAWANMLKKPYTGGSDAHILRTLGSTVVAARAETPNEFIEEVRKKRNHVIGATNTFTAEMRSLGTIMRNKINLGKK